MEIRINEDRADIFTPYNQDFVKKIKVRCGGAKWNAANKHWTVSADQVDTVREIMRDVYGEDDLADTTQQVKLRVTFPEYMYFDKEPVIVCGKTVATAFSRDSGARIEAGVSVKKGGFSSGGSMKNWTTSVEAGTVVEMTVSKTAYENRKALRGVTIEVIEETIDRDALVLERHKLLKRLAEIEEMLKED